jgi:predicted nucleotidyltransferase
VSPSVESKPIHPLIENNREALYALCRQRHVRRLAVFGSIAQDQFDPASSDIDLLVEFEPLPPVQHGDAYFGLLEALERLFQTPVDLIEPGPSANPYFRQAIEQSRVALYEAA